MLLFQIFDDCFDVVMAIGFGGYFQLYMLYTVQCFELVVLQLDDISPC